MARSDQKNLNILLIEDDPGDARLIEELLASAVRAGTEDYLVEGNADGGSLVRAVRYGIERKHVAEALSKARVDLENRIEKRTVELTRANARLKQEVADRKRAEETVRGAAKSLEQQVMERTAELRQLNEALKDEIAERKRTEETLRASEKRYRILFDDNPSMYFTVDSEGTVLSVNRFGALQLGYTAAELVGTSFLDRIQKQDADTAKEFLDNVMRKPGQSHRGEIRKFRKDGTLLWVRATARATQGEDGEWVILIVCEDVTEARELSEELSYQARHDALTGLVNRREFEVRLTQMLQSARADQSEHTLCYLDLDQFKVINDTCGHIAGDELLRQLGGILKGKIRRGDTLGRLGGDEFGILMAHCSLEQARRVTRILLDAIQNFRFAWQVKSFRIGASIGLVPITAASVSVASVLGMADVACYAAKDAGRNRIHVYHEADTELAKRHGEMQWVARINEALEQDRFRLAFQTIAPLKTGGGEHYELLIRMEDETGQIVAPGAFLPIAERYNLAATLDRWVIHTAFAWLATHPEHLQDLYLCSINLSGHSLGDEEFRRFVIDKFNEGQVPPEKICFEITETAAVANLSNAMDLIKVLKELGCRIALDDFGSGLSSFAYLKNLQVDFLKIDGMFVKDIDTDPVALAMVRSINEVGQVMGKRTIAEFVENDAILEKLREIGVDYAQGYGIGRPQPLAEMPSVGSVATAKI